MVIKRSIFVKILFFYLKIRGGSRKKIAKNKIPKVDINRNM